jgi:hypothetical protein
LCRLVLGKVHEAAEAGDTEEVRRLLALRDKEDKPVHDPNDSNVVRCARAQYPRWGGAQPSMCFAYFFL